MPVQQGLETQARTPAPSSTRAATSATSSGTPPASRSRMLSQLPTRWLDASWIGAFFSHRPLDALAPLDLHRRDQRCPRRLRVRRVRQCIYDLLWRDFCDWYLEASRAPSPATPHSRRSWPARSTRSCACCTPSPPSSPRRSPGASGRGPLKVQGPPSKAASPTPATRSRPPPHMVQQTKDQLAKAEAELAAASVALEALG
jgi:hypothetical protein